MNDRPSDHDRQPNLFLRPVVAKTPKAPSIATVVLQDYRDAWALAYAKAWTAPSWAEAMRQSKRLAALLPDGDLRRAFLAAFLADRSPFLTRNGHALRFALTETSFTRYRASAEWAVAERRRFQTAALPPRPSIAPGAVGRRRFGREWVVEAHNRAGAIVIAFGLWARTRPIAERLANLWWMRDAPYGIHDVAVRPRGDS